MRLVVQRVHRAEVSVDGEIVGSIGSGLLVLVGVAEGDRASEAEWLAHKTVNLRIFEDEAGRMNRSLLESGGGLLAVSQFTLYGDVRKGRRPSFAQAAPPEEAERWFERYVDEVRGQLGQVETGRFGAHMEVSLVNDGPVTLILESPASGT